MKRLIASSVVAAVALVLAAPAQPAAPSNAKLARQIKTLQKQVIRGVFGLLKKSL